jgi:hypothetical protein
MATVEDLVLTLSKSSDGTVGVKVSYTATFNAYESSLEGLEFNDIVWIYERKGLRDDKRGFAGEAFTDPADEGIVRMNDGDSAGSFKTSEAKDGKIVRSFEKNLTSDQLSKLRQAGREQPYVVVDLRPKGIDADQKIVELEIDIGDPGE